MDCSSAGPCSATADGWRATTTVQRLADDALEDDPSLEATPVGPDGLARPLADWTASPASR